MNKIKTLILFSALVASAGMYAQTTNTPAMQLATRIAQKMKDSLNLNEQQKNQVYNVNMYLHNQKMLVRQQHTDSVGYYIQKVENKRDSLYRGVLPAAKYQLYLQKKRTLVSAN